MALHLGLETTAIISFGVYSKVYGKTKQGNIATLFASRGYLEGADEITGKRLRITPGRIIQFNSPNVQYHYT